MKMSWIPIVGLTPQCTTCKFFIKDNWLNNDRAGYCKQFPIGETKKEYYFCSVARGFEDMCGEQGKKYESNI